MTRTPTHPDALLRDDAMPTATTAPAAPPVPSEAAIQGACEPAFEPVAQAFAANFASGEEYGAAVAVWQRDRLVVDLWGGPADAAGRPWAADTLVCMMSVAKGVLALCAHRLAERGLLDLDAPVARYWPEFAAAGKARVLVRHLLDHSAGLAALDAALPAGAALDWRVMTEALASATPASAPGAVPAYHPVTMGYLVGEVIRRITGATVGQMLAQEIAVPFGIDYHIGVAPALLPRCAATFGDFSQSIFGAAASAPGSLLARAMAQAPASLLGTPAFMRAELPSINGYGTARAIAQLYGLLARPGGSPLLGAAALARATTMQWEGREATMGHHRRMALGFILGDAPTVPLGPGRRAFGHTGAGGALGFADPETGIGFAYGPNRMHSGSSISPRLQRLVDATYLSLGVGSR